MNRGLGMITALLVLAAAFCMSGTVLCRERNDYMRENERYALLEETFMERTKGILEERGYRNSGVTITWTREQGSARSYLVEIHHRGLESLSEGEREELTETLRDGDLLREAEDFCIIYI